MTRPVGTGTRFRQRKLSTRTALQVVREHDLAFDADQQIVTKFDSGVEKAEETEHHLLVALSTQVPGGAEATPQIYIPTPEIVQTSVPYDQLYTLSFSQPATYIRCSATVEDINGCSYNMSEEDDAFLNDFNGNLSGDKDASTQCSEDQFEEVMDFFEQTAMAQQPYSSVGDPPPVLSYQDMQSAFDENLEENARVFAKDIYVYWNLCRTKNGNTPLQPSLKLKVIEQNTEADDSDPYVCFRRREVRQVRKTRGRDAQSADKLKKMRKEIEDGRHLVSLVCQREAMKRDSMAVDRLLWEQRSALRQVKRILPDQYRDGDEDLLINQKPQKKKVPEANAHGPRGQPNGQICMPARADGRPSEADLVLLADVLTDKENEIEREIKMKIQQHQKWNENYIDWTRAPLTPPLEENFNTSFRPAVTEYLPTPPASVSSEHSGDAVADVGSPSKKQDSVAVRYAAPSFNSQSKSQPAFRRRIGRGGRVMIDRRGMYPLVDTLTLDPRVAERFKYDDEEDDENITYTIDPYEISSMRYRAAISGSHQPSAQAQALRRAQLEQQQAQNNQLASNASASAPGARNASVD